MVIEFLKLLAARRGLPNEAEAVRTVGGCLILPGVIAGMVCGVLIAEVAVEAFGRALRFLPLVNIPVGAVAGGFAARPLMRLAHRTLGFWFVRLVADGLFGAVIGLTVSTLARGVGNPGRWVLLLVPVGALVGVIVGAAVGSAQPAPDECAEPAPAGTDPKPWQKEPAPVARGGRRRNPN